MINELINIYIRNFTFIVREEKNVKNYFRNKDLKDIDIKGTYLGYTYSRLDKLYGYVRYKIYIYYMKARKEV